MNEIMHFTNNPETKEIAEVKVSKNDSAYGLTWANLVRKYLKTAYAGEEAQCEVESFGKTYKVLKRDKVTVFYDESGNTLFDVVNERLQKEYEWIMREGNFAEADKIGGELPDAQTEPESAIGKTIASIERQAFEAVDQKQGTEETENKIDVIQMGTASLADIVTGNIPAPTSQEIAEAEAVMEDQCQAGEVGSTEKEEDIEKQKSMTTGVADAEAKLMEELKKAKPKEFAEPIIEYLVERCRDSESLAADICQDHKTWKGCYDYIVANARKKLNNVSGPVRDDVVFEWAEDYYHLDDKAEAERKAKEEAERKKRRTETAKKATKDKAGKQAAVSADQKVKLVAEKSEKSSKLEKQKRNSKDMEGQMDMFSPHGYVREAVQMDKRALARIPRPELTDKNKEMLLLVPHMCYLVTASRQEVERIDTLIINFFQAEEKELKPKFRVFCQSDDYIAQDLTTDKTKWKTGAINYLTGYLYWYRNGGNIVIASVREREIILGFLYEFKKKNGVKDYQRIMAQGRSVVDTEVEDRIDEYQDTIKEQRLAKRHQKEKDYIDGRMAKFGDLPGDYDTFVEESVFCEENYIFYNLPERWAYCTRCKHDFVIDDKKHLEGKGIPIWNDRDIVKHNRTVRCPWCNSYLQCKSEGMGRQGLVAVQWSTIIQKSGEDVLVRYFRHIKDFRRDFYRPKIENKELFRTVHTAEKSEDYEWYYFKNTPEMRWCYPKARGYSYYPPSVYTAPISVTLYNQDLQEAVAGTCMKYSSIDLYVEHVLNEGKGNSKAWFVDRYFNAYRKSPFLEQLLKVGFYKMANELLTDYDVPELTGGRSILDTLGINKIQYNMLRRIKNPSFRDLEILKYKYGLSWDDFNTLRYVPDNGHYRMYRKFADFMQYTTLHKLTRYMEKQKISHEQDYFDYAGWTEELGYDMHNEFNLFPRDFPRAHDARSKEYTKFKDKQEREAAKRFNGLLKKLKEETVDVEAMNLKASGMFIRLPKRIEELKVEGESLHHCVGTYSERVRKGETMIFFIRLEADPEKPFYTLEWKGKVVQCRGFKNCDMTPEVKEFVKVFEQKMQEYERKPEIKHRKAG